MLFYTKFSRPRKTHTTTPKRPIDGRSLSSMSSCSSSSAWSTVDPIMSPLSWPECGDEPSVIGSPEECRVSEVRIEPTTPRSHRDTQNADVTGKKRKNKEEDLQEVITVAKNIASTLETREFAKKKTNATFVEYERHYYLYWKVIANKIK
ncbi:unnamed protein product [Tenebrio molitor]|nr:unnamed protein product [Tenebrio molitor]